MRTNVRSGALVTTALAAAALLGGCGSNYSRSGPEGSYRRLTGAQERIYEQKRFSPILDAFERRAGADAVLLEVDITIGSVTFDALESGGVRRYVLDEHAKVKSVEDERGMSDLTNIFPVARVHANAPERIYRGIVETTGRHDYRTMFAQLRVDHFTHRLGWYAFAGGQAPSGAFEARPDGTIFKRPIRPPSVAAYAACVRKAGANQTNAKACRKLLPVSAGGSLTQP